MKKVPKILTFGETFNIDDGRDDYIIRENETNFITISQECLAFYGTSAEELCRDKNKVAEFLINYGLEIALAKGKK